MMFGLDFFIVLEVFLVDMFQVSEYLDEMLFWRGFKVLDTRNVREIFLLHSFSIII